MPLRIASVLPLLSLVLLAAPLRAEDRLLFDFATIDAAVVKATDARCTASDGALHVATGKKEKWPGITLQAPEGKFDLGRFRQIAVEVKNTGGEDVRVSCRVDNPGANGSEHCITAAINLKPGEERTLLTPISGAFPPALRDKLFGMRGYPNGWGEKGIDPTNITQVLFFVTAPKVDHAFTLRRLRATGATDAVEATAEKFFPMIDVFGQYKHGDWPGKVHSADDLKRNIETEAADLKSHPSPTGWNQYGGWADGPKQRATGFFRVEKVDGRWWLVDPEGCLFWSHGADCVRDTTAHTPISDREFWFADLPPKDSAFGIFYGTGSNAAHGYYSTRSFATYNFTGANLMRKYGADWKARYADLAHTRLRSWGMNTIANWSDPAVFMRRRTPYTATLGMRGRTRPIEGSQGYWGKFSDVFDPAFAKGMQSAMAAQKDSARDPWCLGYFVDNELSWGDDLSLAIAALASPADQPAKLAFLDDLKAKYASIDRLNAAWGTAHESWDALLQSTTPPDKQKAGDDLAAFYTRVAERYFEVCRDAVKGAAPDHLYLGCRFAWTNQRAVRAACKYCDVVSFNYYKKAVPTKELPDGCDKPTIVGEFHFGALDRGMFHTGLVPTASQQERADCYRAYVRSALDNPNCVGTHWFQFGDQATTGRTDGENYQIGLLDVCDTPYPETIGALREVGAEMYSRRSGK
jgi:tRNA(Leu) C34 or U34 (ribose-2'-O)-methylase TrmL